MKKLLRSVEGANRSGKKCHPVSLRDGRYVIYAGPTTRDTVKVTENELIEMLEIGLLDDKGTIRMAQADGSPAYAPGALRPLRVHGVRFPAM